MNKPSLKDYIKYSNYPYERYITLFDIIDNIDRYKELDRLDMRPDFQRGHVWTESQQIAYIEYIINGGSSGKIFFFNHPGFGTTFKGQMQLVDGLQRLTAIQEFMNGNLKIFGGYTINDFDQVKSALRQIDVTFIINTLKTRKEVLEWYVFMNSGGTPHSEKEIERVKRLIEEEL